MIPVALEVLDPRSGRSRLVECAHSWVRQMADMWLVFVRQTNVIITDTGGVGRGVAPTVNEQLNVLAGGGDDNFGILVGTSAVAPTRDDFNLGAKIPHGSAAGQLVHQAVVLSNPLAIAGGRRVSAQRQFDNSSGGPITVEELALVVRGGTGLNFFLVLHDSVTEAIPDGASRVFKYHLDWVA